MAKKNKGRNTLWKVEPDEHEPRGRLGLLGLRLRLGRHLGLGHGRQATGPDPVRSLAMTDVHLSPSGPPDTILEPEPDDALEALRAALVQVDGRRDAVADVCVVGAVSRFEFLRSFPRVFRGTHVSHPAVDMHRGKVVELASLDSSPAIELYGAGERIGPLPARLEAVPGELQVVVPDTAPVPKQPRP